MDGIEATERIRAYENEHKITEKVWIIAMTSNADDSDCLRYEACGMNGCIQKGQLLADSVKRCMQKLSENPSLFVVTTKASEDSEKLQE